MNFSSDWEIVELLEDNKKKQEKKDEKSISVNFNGTFIDEKELKKLFKEATLLYENDLLSKILFGND